MADQQAIPSHDPDSLPRGTSLLDGRYVIRAQIGRGGAATVYSAEHKGGSKVALKILASRRQGDAAQEQRFLNEAALVRKLPDHHGIVRTREVGYLPELGGRLYMTMDLVRGPTLALALADGPLRPRRACETIRAVASTVAFLHTHGIIHRDIKPANIILPQDDLTNAKLLDFGYAFELGSEAADDRLTLVDQRPGTKFYMAPEQALGYSPAVSFDVYALGVTLYETLVGTGPHAAKRPDEAMRLKCDPNAPELTLRDARPDLPEALLCLVEEALRRDPAQRIATADAFLQRLDDVLSSLGTDSPALVMRGGRADATQMISSGSLMRADPDQVAAGTVVTPKAEDEITKPEGLAKNKPAIVIATPPPALRSSATSVRQLPTLPSTPPTDPDVLKVVDGSRKWVIGIVVGLLAITVGVGAWLLRPDEPGPSSSKDSENVPPPRRDPVSSPEALPKAAPPSPPESPSKRTAPPLPPEPVEPAAVPVFPEPTEVVESPSSKRAKAPAAPRPSPAPAVAAAETPDCEQRRADAKAAAAKLDSASVLQLIKRKECWADADALQALRIEALYDLGRMEECAKAAKTRTPASVRGIAQRCIDAAKP